MKTSYVYKNRKNNPDTPENEARSGADRPALDVYFYLRGVSEEKAKEREKLATEVSLSKVPQNEEDFKVDKPPKKKKKGKLGLILGLSAAVIVLGVGGVFVFKSHTNKVLNEEYSQFCTALNSYCSEDSLSKLEGLSESDIEALQGTLNNYKEKGIDVSDTSVQLLDMAQYLIDSESIGWLKDPERDITSDEFIDKLDRVQSNADYYTTESLKNAVSKECLAIESQLQVYSYVKDTLLSLEDYSTVSEEYLSSEINSLWYLDAISECTLLKNKMLSVKPVVVEYNEALTAYESAVSLLEEISAVQYNEDGSEVELSKEEIQEKDAAIANQTQVVNEAKAVLDEKTAPIVEALLSVAQVIDTIEGTTGYSDKVNAQFKSSELADTLE